MLRQASVGVSCSRTPQSLDIQYTVGLATGVPITFVDVGQNTQDGLGGFLDIMDALLEEDNPPSVLTTSFGFNEADLPSSLAQYVPTIRMNEQEHSPCRW